jgi:hypothetical protein
MKGKIFVSLVIGVLGIINALLYLSVGKTYFGLSSAALGVGWLVAAYRYQRNENA